MKTSLMLCVLFAATAAATVANADILLENKDGHACKIAVRHPTSTVTTEIPARGYMVLSAGATSIQMRDKQGRDIGKPLEVEDGDRVTVKNGTITRVAGGAGDAGGLSY